ncbi:MAG: hypothetical protein LH478_07670 [Chitinophagaceae bacterium]|nr:hypothetical protein [Chitinophagaceae bacterium]
MAYVKLNEYVYDCSQCHTRCDGISKGTYRFENDVQFSEHYENLVIKRINKSEKYIAAKCLTAGYPDIEIKTKAGNLHHYLEIKVQQRTFMAVKKYLPESGLMPSETVALNLSDLLRYFAIKEQTGVPSGILWVVLNRLCIIPAGHEQMFYQDTQILQSIYKTELLKRKFTRKSGEGDVVDGVHKGVTVNYHFSLKELRPWNA